MDVCKFETSVTGAVIQRNPASKEKKNHLKQKRLRNSESGQKHENFGNVFFSQALITSKLPVSAAAFFFFKAAPL